MTYDLHIIDAWDDFNVERNSQSSSTSLNSKSFGNSRISHSDSYESDKPQLKYDLVANKVNGETLKSRQSKKNAKEVSSGLESRFHVLTADSSDSDT